MFTKSTLRLPCGYISISDSFADLPRRDQAARQQLAEGLKLEAFTPQESRRQRDGLLNTVSIRVKLTISEASY